MCAHKHRYSHVMSILRLSTGTLEGSAAQATSESPSVTTTFGAVLLSTFFSLILYGLTGHQTYRYFRMYRSDKLFYQVLVLVIFIADTFHSAILMHICYYYLAANYLNPQAMMTSIWSVQVLGLSTGIVALLAQCFYVRRVYLVNRQYRPVVALVCTLMLVEFGFIISILVNSLGHSSFEALENHALDAVLFAVATAIDLILTGALVMILRQSRTRYRHTNMVLDTLALYAVIATALVTVITFPAFICVIALPGTFIYFAIALPATKVYSNSVLAFLNCRKSLAARATCLGSEPVAVGLRNRPEADRSASGASGTIAASSYVNVKLESTRTPLGEDK
ncbi:hypothetical protein C8Q80DRAFT_668521 [Daedaleopsis nitida]|nr:hypothetical protein C8Q80DRAFT_668521 [Daedaleopsis nitida]